MKLLTDPGYHTHLKRSRWKTERSFKARGAEANVGDPLVSCQRVVRGRQRHHRPRFGTIIDAGPNVSGTHVIKFECR